MTAGNVGWRRAVFVDTSAFYVLVNDRDATHDEAVAILRGVQGEDREIVTSNFVVAETHALLVRRLGRNVAIEFVRSIHAGLATVVRVEEADEERAVAIIEGYADKAFSYTDATSFAVMERLGVTTAFSFDRHFPQFGLVTLGLDD